MVDLRKQISYPIYEFFAMLLIHTICSRIRYRKCSVSEYHEIEKKYERYFSEYEIYSNKFSLTDTN